MKLISKVYFYIIIIFLSFTKKSTCSLFDMFEKFGATISEKVQSVIPLIRKATEENKNLKEINIFLNFNIIENQNKQTTNINANDWKKEFEEQYNNQKQNLKANFSSLSDYLSKNKTKVAYFTAFSTYCLINFRLGYLRYKLNDNNCWSLWNKETPLQEFFETSQTRFSQNLLKDAHRKYATVDNLTNFSKPFLNLMQDLEQEKKYLTQYKKITDLIERIYLKKLFFYDINFVSNISQRLDRIAYIKNTFLNWLSEYKLNNAKDFLDK